MQALAGQRVHVHGQRAGGIEHRHGTLTGEIRDLGDGAGRENERGHLAHAPAERQYHTCLLYTSVSG